ncbi:OmpA family protein [Candidatus Pacearchaeota archaeon]|nr:OmpA family protein [Candidatus Pacearchaeota archaeon]
MRKICIILLCLLFLLSCANMGQKQKTGTAVGVGVGAAGGAAIGHAYGGKHGMIIGGLIGAIVGGIAGNQVGAYMDQQEAALNTAMSSSIAANQASIYRSQDVLMATFKSDVFFDLNSSILKPGAYAELDRVANVLNQYPQTNVQIQGHTDKSGTEQYNMNLSQYRAEAVRTYMIQRHVDPSRLVAIGLGESQPISSSNAQNRRVTMVLTPIVSNS